MSEAFLSEGIFFKEVRLALTTQQNPTQDFCLRGEGSFLLHQGSHSELKHWKGIFVLPQGWDDFWCVKGSIKGRGIHICNEYVKLLSIKTSVRIPYSFSTGWLCSILTYKPFLIV